MGDGFRCAGGLRLWRAEGQLLAIRPGLRGVLDTAAVPSLLSPL
jgi:hypothetical protein